MLLRKIRIRVMLMVLLLQGIFVSTAHAIGVGGSGMYQWSVDLRGYISSGGSYDKEVVIHSTEAICKFLQQIHKKWIVYLFTRNL